MTMELHQPSLGEINITTRVLETIAAKAASEVEGVHKLHSSFQKEVGGLLGMDSTRVGARVKRQGSEISIDVEVHLAYGYSIPEVAIKVQQRVKEQILFMTDLVVQEVNVHVVTIETDKGKETDYFHLAEEDEVLGELSE
ncbi:Asp23/Gls24 family envelope stress response protein [Aerococcaceae bacterium NML191292]|nr:Asp23/Gls24 family envelope stress response protein [Aerococcaceae bacterium NML191292]